MNLDECNATDADLGHNDGAVARRHHLAHDASVLGLTMDSGTADRESG
jgi:hypothetical protein